VEAASNLIFFLQQFAAMRLIHGNMIALLGPTISPVTAVPATTPMTMVPAPPAPVTPMPGVSPVNFFGFEMIDLAFCNERGFRAIAARRRKPLRCLDRRQRRRIRADGKRCGASNDSKTKFQKLPAFHGNSSFSTWW